MKALRLFALPLLGLAILAALVHHLLQREGGAPVRAGPPVLRLWADPALRLPLESPDLEHERGLLGRFERRTGIRARVTYGDRALWEEAPEHREETDLVLTSDARWMESIEAGGAPGDRTAFARHVPVILVHASSRAGAPGPAFLRAPERRLAAGDLHGTVLGQMTVALLTHDAYSADELRRHVAYLGHTADDVARAVEEHRADAAIVWKDTALRHARRTVVEPWPDPTIEGPAVYALRPGDSPRGDAAAQLVRFLAGPAARSLLQAYGFAPSDNGGLRSSPSPGMLVDDEGRRIAR